MDEWLSRANALFGVSNALFLVLSPEGRIVAVNDRACELLGVARDALVGKCWFDEHIPDRERAVTRERFDALMAGATAPPVLVQYENPVRRADGSERWIRWHNMVLVDEAGRAIGTCSSGYDVTEERHARDVALRRQALLAAIASAARALLNADEWEQTVPRILEILGPAAGASRAMLLITERRSENRGVVVEVHEWCAPGVPSARPALLGMTATSEQHRENRERLAGGAVLRIKRSQGPETQRYLEATGTHSSVLAPVFDERRPRAMLCLEDCERERAWDEGEAEALENLASILGDRIRRQRAEHTLRFQREQHRRALEAMRYGVTRLDTSGRHTYANPAYRRLIGYSLAELEGLCLWDRAPTDDERELVRSAFDRSVDPRVPIPTLHSRCRCADGSILSVDIDLVPDIGPRGEVVGRVAVVTDVTEHLRAREALERSLREKNVLLREVHHRVKNNLQIVASLLRLQQLGDVDDLDEVLHAASHRISAIALVHDVLTRGEDVSQVDLAAYVAALVESLRGCLELPGVGIEIVHDCEPMSIALDVAVPVGLALNEAITNALEHAYPPATRGRVCVLGRRLGGGEIELTVRDDGRGLPDSVDIDKPRTLGLQLIRELAAQVGGRARIRTGSGTEVVLTVPGAT